MTTHGIPGPVDPMLTRNDGDPVWAAMFDQILDKKSQSGTSMVTVYAALVETNRIFYGESP